MKLTHILLIAFGLVMLAVQVYLWHRGLHHQIAQRLVQTVVIDPDDEYDKGVLGR